MTTNIIIISAILFSGLLTVYILNSIINSRIKKKISGNEIPLTVDILKMSFFICSGLLLSEIFASFQTMTKILPATFSGKDLLLNEIMYFCIYLGIILIAIFIIIWLSSLMYAVVSNGKNIFIESANNNLSSVLLFSGILLALAFAIKSGITPLLDLLIPYPTLPIYH